MDCHFCDNSKYKGTELFVSARFKNAASTNCLGTSRRANPFLNACNASSSSVSLMDLSKSLHIVPDDDDLPLLFVFLLPSPSSPLPKTTFNIKLRSEVILIKASHIGGQNDNALPSDEHAFRTTLSSHCNR